MEEKGVELEGVRVRGVLLAHCMRGRGQFCETCHRAPQHLGDKNQRRKKEMGKGQGVREKGEWIRVGRRVKGGMW